MPPHITHELWEDQGAVVQYSPTMQAPTTPTSHMQKGLSSPSAGATGQRFGSAATSAASEMSDENMPKTSCKEKPVTSAQTAGHLQTVGAARPLRCTEKEPLR